jgi:hypothetical protein
MSAFAEWVGPKLLPFALWLKSTALSEAILSHSWVWPACETLHFIGLALIIGVAGFLDIRLLGAMTQVPVSAIHRMVKWAKVGLVMNFLTGLVFLIGAPDQYVANFAWWYKVLFLIIAGANAMFFETTQGQRVLELGANQPVPTTFKIVGAVSLVCWFGVLYWGRMMPFVGGSF